MGNLTAQNAQKTIEESYLCHPTILRICDKCLLNVILDLQRTARCANRASPSSSSTHRGVHNYDCRWEENYLLTAFRRRQQQGNTATTPAATTAATAATAGTCYNVCAGYLRELPRRRLHCLRWQVRGVSRSGICIALSHCTSRPEPSSAPHPRTDCTEFCTMYRTVVECLLHNGSPQTVKVFPSVVMLANTPNE